MQCTLVMYGAQDVSAIGLAASCTFRCTGGIYICSLRRLSGRSPAEYIYVLAPKKISDFKKANLNSCELRILRIYVMHVTLIRTSIVATDCNHKRVERHSLHSECHGP